MPARTFAAVIAAPLVALACGAHGAIVASRGLVCPAPPSPIGCWEQLRPVGSGGFPAEPGSRDRPLWAPGKIPVTLLPVVAFGGDLWMVSQTHSYSSADGLVWSQHDKVDWGERIGQSFVFFRDRLWMLGGLDYRTKRPLNDVWSSADGVHWQSAGVTAWPERKGAAVVAFNGRLWLLGGTSEVNSRFDAVRTLNDVWSSEDGIRWSQVIPAAPWKPRDQPRVVMLGDALYLLGGSGSADVWRSTDGESWTQLAAEAPWGGGRHGYGGEAFDSKLWVFGGWIGPPTNALNDVWCSTDGASWTRLAEHAPWGPRSPRSVVFGDRLWIFSGKHTGGSDSWGGDVWVMLPTGSSAARSLPSSRSEAGVKARIAPSGARAALTYPRPELDHSSVRSLSDLVALRTPPKCTRGPDRTASRPGHTGHGPARCPYPCWGVEGCAWEPGGRAGW